MKVEVHHRDGINWHVIIEKVFEEILVHPDKMECLCKQCHADEKEDHSAK